MKNKFILISIYTMAFLISQLGHAAEGSVKVLKGFTVPAVTQEAFDIDPYVPGQHWDLINLAEAEGMSELYAEDADNDGYSEVSLYCFFSMEPSLKDRVISANTTFNTTSSFIHSKEDYFDGTKYDRYSLVLDNGVASINCDGDGKKFSSEDILKLISQKVTKLVIHL